MAFRAISFPGTMGICGVSVGSINGTNGVRSEKLWDALVFEAKSKYSHSRAQHGTARDHWPVDRHRLLFQVVVMAVTEGAPAVGG